MIFCKYCKYCKFDEDFSYAGDFVCRKNVVMKHNFYKQWKEYLLCEVVNENNQCHDFKNKFIFWR